MNTQTLVLFACVLATAVVFGQRAALQNAVANANAASASSLNAAEADSHAERIALNKEARRQAVSKLRFMQWQFGVNFTQL